METHDKGREDHGDDNALVLDFLGESLGPCLETALGARVGRQQGRRNPAAHRTDVEHQGLGRAALGGPGDHRGQDGSRQVERRQDVLRGQRISAPRSQTYSLDDVVHLGLGGLGERDGHLMRLADVVD